MSEDVDVETPKVGRSLDMEDSPSENYRNVARNPVRTYMENVDLYTARDLSKPEDILSAFGGVGKTLCKRLGADSVFGLPNSHFDLALLWDPADAPRRRTSGKNVSFPSWSWCGWEQRNMLYRDYTVSDCMMYLHEWLMQHTWITYYIRDGNGDLRLVWDAERHGQRSTELESTICGYRKRDEQSYGHYDLYGRKIPDTDIGLERNEFKRTIPDFPIQVRTLQPGEDSASAVGEDYSILQFWTWSACFKLQAEGSPSPSQIFSRRYSIIDRNGSWAGTIVLNKAWTFDRTEAQHFIAISEARTFWPNEMSPIPKNDYSATKREWPLYNVLLLGHDQVASTDAGVDRSSARVISYRVGLGKVYQAAFHQAFDQAGSSTDPYTKRRKVWREIVLG